ncbi:MAG: RNA-binding protein [Fimbriimonadaceae bacterium]|nr:RNA-binding protein [Chitinophagales bacterium]
MNIYVSGLSYKLTNDDLRLLFEQHGEVTSAKIIMDKFTQQSRGFGFVEMPEGGQKAIDSLHESVVQGKKIEVSVAKPQTERKTFGRY